jgi:hypothetical protein
MSFLADGTPGDASPVPNEPRSPPSQMPALVSARMRMEGRRRLRKVWQHPRRGSPNLLGISGKSV